MPLYSQLDQPTKEVLNAHINRRWGQLYQLQKEWGERAFKYLFLTNSGGAIATLSFLGAANELTGLGTKIALFLFVLGIVFAGISTAKTFHHMSGLLKKYKQGVEDFYADKITWTALTDNDNERAVASWLDYLIPYLSFFCFIMGSGAGAYALFV
jgi:hypothetical protein